MNEDQILLSTPMVRAILEGRKTQARLPVTPRPAINKAGKPYWKTPQGTPRVVSVNACPLGKAGERLWVREAFTTIGLTGTEIYYRATPLDDTFSADVITETDPSKLPSFILEIASVKVERLHDITATACLAEGYQPLPSSTGEQGNSQAQVWFRREWESENDENPWETNPWVWVISFQKLSI